MADQAAWQNIPEGSVGAWDLLMRRLARAVDLLQSGELTNLTAVSAAFTLRTVSYHEVVVMTGTHTVTLPPAIEWKGRLVTVKRDSGAGTVTVDGNSSETIDGSATMAWATASEARTFTSTGSAVLRIG